MKRPFQKIKNLLLLLILISIPYTSYFPQNDLDREINKQFDTALTQFNSGDYNLALISFSKIIDEYDYNSKIVK